MPAADLLVAAEAQASPEAGAGGASAGVGARRVPTDGASGRLLVTGAEVVAGTSTADVSHGGSLLAHLSTGELFVEGKDGSLDGSMGVAGTAAAGVEAAGALGGRDRGSLGRNAGGRGSCRGSEEVACTTTSGVRKAVFGNGGVGFGDGISGHFGESLLRYYLVWLLLGVVGWLLSRRVLRRLM